MDDFVNSKGSHSHDCISDVPDAIFEISEGKSGDKQIEKIIVKGAVVQEIKMVETFSIACQQLATKHFGTEYSYVIQLVEEMKNTQLVCECVLKSSQLNGNLVSVQP